MDNYSIDEEKLIKRRLNFYNVNEKIIPSLKHLISKEQNPAKYFEKDKHFVKPSEENLGIMCNQYLGKMVFQMKKNFRYLSLASKKGLTMRLSEISTLFRKVFTELLQHIEVYPMFDETLAEGVMLKCVNKVSYPFSTDDFKKLRYKDSKYFGYKLDDVKFESDFLDYDSLYITRINCGKYICDMD